MANSCQTAGVLEIKMVENHCYKAIKIFSYGGPWSAANLGVLDMKKFENHCPTASGRQICPIINFLFRIFGDYNVINTLTFGLKSVSLYILFSRCEYVHEDNFFPTNTYSIFENMLMKTST